MPVTFPPGWARLSDEPGPHRVAERDHDDRNGAGCGHRSLRGRGGADGDDVCFQAQTFRGERRKPLAIALRGKVVDGDVLPVHIAKIAQALEERVESGRLQRTGIERKEAQPRDILGRLRARRERPGRRAADKRDELAPFHCPMPPVLPTERIAHLRYGRRLPRCGISIPPTSIVGH